MALLVIVSVIFLFMDFPFISLTEYTDIETSSQ